jgi:site-specific recombinase XerD
LCNANEFNIVASDRIIRQIYDFLLFGTLLLSAGIPINSTSKMMGHADISVTQAYAKITDDKISEDMDKLIERRKAVK